MVLLFILTQSVQIEKLLFQAQSIPPLSVCHHPPIRSSKVMLGASSSFLCAFLSNAVLRPEPPDLSLLSMRGTADPIAHHELRTRSLSRTLKQRGASDSRFTGAAVSGLHRMERE
ncbi:hypothetical protein F2P79_007612 [Pimephales promelas]|nr:hypothetical protein F2P79_007612 [Pimephales promelas]